MVNLSDQLITPLQNSPSEDALIKILKEQKPSLVFRISVITEDRKTLYDSAAKPTLGLTQESIVNSPEVQQAFAQGQGYFENYSKSLDQPFAYMAKAFSAHGKKYILRTAFPLTYVNELTKNFELSFIILSVLALLLFSLLTTTLLHYLTKPIQTIISAVSSYQETKKIPEITLSKAQTSDDVFKLASTINSLSESVQGQVQALTEERNKKEKLLETLKDFIANASHELKTPITIISGFSEMLQEHKNIPSEQLEEIAGRIHRNCQRMNVLVKDLLILADVEDLPLHQFEQIDLEKLVQKVAANITEYSQNHHLTIVNRSHKKILFEGASDLIEMALYNLIQNAIRYSKPPAQVTVTLDQKDNWVEIEVQDQGIGIPKEDLERIFERFYRVDKARSQKLGGSGLGLAIVDTIIKKHKGKMAVQSEFGKGSQFTMFLPIKQERNL